MNLIALSFKLPYMGRTGINGHKHKILQDEKVTHEEENAPQ